MKTSTKPIICCGFTPCVQRIVEFEKVEKGAVNRASRVNICIGGKGANTARMVHQLGNPSELVEFVGGANGRLLEEMLKEEGIGFRHLEVEGETRICQTLVEAGNPDTTELVEEMPPISSNDWKRMQDLFQSLELSGAVVPISGKLPAGAPVDGYAQICQMVQSAGGRVILDTQVEPLMLSLEHRPALVKINDHELRAATGVDDLLKGCRRLIELGAQSVLITRGPRSAFFVDSSHALEISPLKIEAVNPIGSGDAVTAGMAIALNQGLNIEESLKLAMACGASNALNLISGYLKPEDVERLKNKVEIVPA
ncbi:1-phosphofructokinase family hexose kinase [Pontiellaceae bacterium B12227]|nr:1-phosphofructokinase family hexose kinase [Pontiellaceae bacterium B12227]